MPSKSFTSNLTSYDLLKTLALLLMLVDHVGYFFFPEDQMFRAIGRASLPIWMFLVGFARTRELPKLLVLGAGALFVSNIVLGGGLLPLSILVTIILTRFVLDTVSSVTFRNWETAIYGTFLLSVMNAFMLFLTEYGTAALLIAMAGYLVRNGDDINLTDRAKKIFMGYTVAFYSLCQLIVFSRMDKFEAQIMVITIGLVSIILYYFKPTEVTAVEQKLPRPAVLTLQFMGRYTLEIYIAHLILFKLVACIYGLAGHGWFNWDLIR